MIAVKAQNKFYEPQTYRQNVDGYQKGHFAPTESDPRAFSQPWNPGTSHQGTWREPDSVAAPNVEPFLPKPEPWKLPYSTNKEQNAVIIHHKQALTSEGGFRFEYASDNGQAAGEVIEPDGSRIGGYQYKDPSGQLVKLKYRAGKDGFQILEGSHLPKSQEPQLPRSNDNFHQDAYSQQKQQYEMQQQYDQQKPDPQQNWRNNQEYGNDHSPAGGQYFVRNWREQDLRDDDGQYHDNDLEDKKPHSFGSGYAFSFKG